MQQLLLLPNTEVLTPPSVNLARRLRGTSATRGQFAKPITKLPQVGYVIWLFGLSGAGKTTLSTMLESRLQYAGYRTVGLDGDAIRSGLNSDLGFSDEDRQENIRRAAEMAKLLCATGLVTIVSFITPREELRDLVRQIVGPEKLLSVYLHCPFETCAQRDVKGLYAKAVRNEVAQFTGLTSPFEAPTRCDLTLDTSRRSKESCLGELEVNTLARLVEASNLAQSST